MQYHHIKPIQAQGLVHPNLERDHRMQRLPQTFKGSIRKEVWKLSENSAGVSIPFVSDTSELLVKWSLKHDQKMNHMTDVGIKGIDLYHKKNGAWKFLNTGIPTKKENKEYLFKGFSPELREYRLHLPLYDTVTDIQFGLVDGSKFDRIEKNTRPIVFYGTSITQGGCASRPGLAYTNIISRELDNECINLGFSGNGHLETPVAEILSTIDAKIYVIECMANIDKEIVRKNTIPLIKAIRKNVKVRSTPIVFFEQFIIDLDSPDQDMIDSALGKNKELNNQVTKAINDGEENLHVIKQVGCIDEDTEATVDGIHFNDLGFQRYANYFINSIHELNIF